MNNPEDFGKIYCSTWWGDYRNIQFSIPNKSDCILPLPVQAYITRVEYDGGIVESKECLANRLVVLGWESDRVYRYETQRYVDRVESAGGIIEGEECLDNKIIYLLYTN